MGNNKKNVTSHPGNIGRRDFIRQSAVVCCMANLPLAALASSEESQSKMAAKGVSPAELATYCGLYCGACDIYQKRISQSGNELKYVLDVYDFGSFAGQIPGLEEYEKFYKVLNTLIAFFGQCPACLKGGGNPQCAIRICAREKGYQTCAECASFPCDKVKVITDGYPDARENLMEIKETGLEKWCKKQQELVDKGLRYSTILAKQKAGSK